MIDYMFLFVKWGMGGNPKFSLRDPGALCGESLRAKRAIIEWRQPLAKANLEATP